MILDLHPCAKKLQFTLIRHDKIEHFGVPQEPFHLPVRKIFRQDQRVRDPVRSAKYIYAVLRKP